MMELQLNEVEIEPSPELLWRQVVPSTWNEDEGQPHTHAFGPKTSDEGKPSYSRSSKVEAEEAYEWHNANARSQSQGVWACSSEEVVASDLRTVDDSETEIDAGVIAPGHCYVDFRELPRKEIKARRNQLWLHAMDRGKQHP